ncbi:hypothetical protein PHYPSEUDO_007369 [Phytophthora pseudosyringae]|uniref:DUF1697 domain-containing protein n=1 Tax=Phytophthora pseudosyringae TaxID=221518 RepID=A0A8T1WHD2_9STRA|nr:hypothetical protein PHYPSEUDO_007369 [Phytophthora pseudosyringae]
MVAKAKRKAVAPADSSPTAKRITRPSGDKLRRAAAGESSASEDSQPPACAADEASTSSASRKIVAFLRGVNVGGRVHSMKSIADALGKAGFSNVKTFLASGNVVFDAPGATDKSSVLTVEQRVEAALEELFGCHIPVFARSMEEVAALGERVVKSAMAVNVVLMKEELTKEQRDIVEALSSDADELKLLDRAFVWYSTTKMSESPLFKVAFDKKLGLPVTVRTVNTLRRIVTKFG